jgi:hypothetical protein
MKIILTHAFFKYCESKGYISEIPHNERRVDKILFEHPTKYFNWFSLKTGEL